MSVPQLCSLYCFFHTNFDLFVVTVAVAVVAFVAVVAVVVGW